MLQPTHTFRLHRNLLLNTAVLSCALFMVFGIFCISHPGRAYGGGADVVDEGKAAIDKKTRNKIIKQQLADAKRLYKEGRYIQALELWKNVLAIDRNNRSAKAYIKKAESKISRIKGVLGEFVFYDSERHGRLTLEDCLSVAARSSLALGVAEEQIGLSKMKVVEAQRALLPSLALLYSRTSGIQSGGKIEGVEYGIEAKQPAFHSGEFLYGLAQARATLDIANENYNKVKSELYAEVSEAYYAFARAEKFSDFIGGLYSEIKPLYEIARKEYERGLISEVEHLNADSKYNQIYYRKISSASDYKLAKLALEQKLNVEDLGADKDVSVLLGDTVPDISEDINECISLAMGQRPDLLMSEAAVKSTEYGKKMAQAREMPSVDLTGNYKRAAEVYRESFSALNTEQKLDPHKKWYAGLEVTWPFMGSTGSYSLYKREDPPTLSAYNIGSESKGSTWKLGVLDNLKQLTDAKEYEIAYIRAVEDLDEMRKKVIMEVKEAYHGYEKGRIQFEATAIEQEFRTKELNILKIKYGYGQADLPELFESCVELMEAAEAYFQAEEGLFKSIIALNKAMGVIEGAT